MLPVDTQVPVPGSYNSALARKLPKLSLPPATRTLPLASSVAVNPLRAILMLPVAVQVPGCVVVAFRAGVSATDLFNAATARNTPAEQSTPPSATRGMKKADREVDFVFIMNDFFLYCLFSLRV